MMTLHPLSTPYGEATQVRIASLDYDQSLVFFVLLRADGSIVQEGCVAPVAGIEEKSAGETLPDIQAALDAQR